MRTIVTNIGEFFTGEIATPTAPVSSILVEGGTVSAFDPPADTQCDSILDVRGGAVLPGLIDGHVHPVFGEWTPAQNATGWIENYLHGGTTTMVSAGELHAPGLDYENLTPDLVTSLAEIMRATTGRVRWSGVKLHAGTVLLVPGMKEAHFDRLAKSGVAFAKFLFYPFKNNPAEAMQYVTWCRERAIRVKVHTGGVSRSGLSQICGFDILSWLQPDIAAHISGGPIPMSDADLLRTINETSFYLEICSSGNYRSTLLAMRWLRERGRLDRVTLGTDTPGGTGVIPRGMLRNVLYLSAICDASPGEAIAIASGNTARAHGLDNGVLRPGAPADLIVCGPVQGSTGQTLADAVTHGDLPGISYVMVDGKIVVDGRSRQTPPPEETGGFFSSQGNRPSTANVLIARCGCD